MKLDQLTQGWEMFEAAIEAEGGELTESLAQRMDFLNLNERSKADNYVFYLKALEGECDQLKKLEDELATKRRTKEKRYDWLKERVKQYMAGREMEELKGEVFKFKLVKAGKRPVEIVAPLDKLPPSWVKTERKPILEAIRIALEMHEGNVNTLSSLARLGEPTMSLRIY
jgi:hypothetical protein